MLVLLDWDSIYRIDWCLHHKRKVSNLIFLDVLVSDLCRTVRTQSFAKILWFLLYQWWLTAAFILGLIIPLAGNLTIGALSVLRLDRDLAHPPKGVLRRLRGLKGYMCYPYFHFWKNRPTRSFRSHALESIDCPALFAYGKKKRVIFHFQEAIENLSQKFGHRIIAYDCGHRIQHAKTYELNAKILFFKNFHQLGRSKVLSHTHKQKVACIEAPAVTIENIGIKDLKQPSYLTNHLQTRSETAFSTKKK